MAWIHYAAGVAVIAFAPCAAEPPPVNHPPVAAFGEIPVVANPQLSPDGEHYVTIENLEGRPAAVIRPVDPGSEEAFLVHNNKDLIVHARWVKKDRVLIWLDASVPADSRDSRVITRSSIISVGTHGNPPTKHLGCGVFLTELEPRIVDFIPDADRDVLVALHLPPSHSPDHVSISELCRTDSTYNGGYTVARGSGDTVQWITDGAGHVIGRIDQTRTPLKDHLFLLTGPNTWAEIATIDASEGHGLDIEGIDVDVKSLVMGASQPSTGMNGLIRIKLQDGGVSDFFFDPHYDVAETLHDPWTLRVVGVTVIGDRAGDHYFTPELKIMQASLEKAFPGRTVRALSWDRAQNRLTLRVSGPRNPPAYYLYDRTTHHAELLLQAYPGLSESDLGEMKPYPYKARDGLDIPAYLTLPPGKEAKNLPMVVMPHGGPMARDQIDFDWMAQFLANRGYAVLQPNFRGSSGYGTKFLEAGFGEWGLKMQNDLTDGVKKLIADGIADPKRICIVGASYGGYAALAGAAFTPDLYACAASWGGVFDLRAFLDDRERDFGEDSAMISSWSHFIGDRAKDGDKLDAASPAKQAARITSPVLLMHGADDTTVRVEQSEEMDRALRRAQKKVTFLSVPRDVHYMLTSASRIRWLTELEKFLMENIGN